MRPKKLINKLIHPFFNTSRTRQIFHVNPTVQPVRLEASEIKIGVYDYNGMHVDEHEVQTNDQLLNFRDNKNVSWINIDGLRKSDVEEVCTEFGIHNLIVEDILSVSQRPKMDEIDNILYCLLNMLYFNDHSCSIELEQISIVLGENYVITFQEDKDRDVFNTLREKLKMNHSKLRNKGSDYLCYNLLDMIVDHYFVVMEKLGEKIELLEEEIIRHNTVRSLARINNFRKELIVLKRNVAPVRDLINGFIKTESELINEENTKYFKDIYDHIHQANDVVDNYRDMLNNLHDLYISKVNLKTNEVMKVMAVVTCMLAPATVIGGIFCMNFHIIPYQNQAWAFYAAVLIMLVIVPFIMLVIFKRRGWF